MAIRIEYSILAMDYRTQPRTEAHPEIRLYARSVRKTGLAGLGAGTGVAHADDVECHVSPGGALWCQDMDTGQSSQESNYGEYPYQPSYCSQPYVTSQWCS